MRKGASSFKEVLPETTVDRARSRAEWVGVPALDCVEEESGVLGLPAPQPPSKAKQKKQSAAGGLTRLQSSLVRPAKGRECKLQGHRLTADKPTVPSRFGGRCRTFDSFEEAQPRRFCKLEHAVLLKQSRLAGAF